MIDPITVTFDEARWRRVGATDDEIAELQATWDSSTDEERAGLAGWMQSSVDSALTAWLTEAFGQGDRLPTKNAEDPEDGSEAGDDSAQGPEPGDDATGGSPGVPETGPNDGQETKPPES